MMDKNTIQELLDRFMDGATTLDEERRLADWFRTAIVPEEWTAYKDMFAYFDAGMPTDEQLPEAQAKDTVVRRKARRWWAAAAAVAAVAAVVAVSVWSIRNGLNTQSDTPQVATINHPATPPKSQSPKPETAATDTTLKTTEVQSDSLPAATKPQPKRPSMKHRYEPAPPKTYLAEAAPATNPADSIDAAAAQLAEAKLREVEQRQQAYLKAVAIKDYINTLDIAAVTDEEEEIY